MLDGQVLGASQVEYKPFGKLPLKREQFTTLQPLRTAPPPQNGSGRKLCNPRI